MEDLDLGSHAHENQPLTSTPPTPPYNIQYYQQNPQWRPTTPNMASPPLTNTTSPMPRRATGEFSRQWKSPPTAAGFYLGSARTSSETIRPPSRSSISSAGDTALPRKYIGPEMNRVLHRHRLSVESGRIVIGRPGSEKDSMYRRKTLASTSLLRWIPEAGSIVGGVVCLVAIAILLKSYNGNPQPDWPGPFNLHGVVALLAVLAQAAYLVPVVQGLGQLRWLIYSGSGQNSRPLRDFEVIDSATRGGIHGSFGLLFGYQKGGILGMLGAFIIITSLFTTPLTQGMISYTAELIPGDPTDTDPSRNATTATGHSASSLDGTPYTYQSMVHIHWGYLVPLLIQLILSAVFLVSVVICTRRDGIQIIKTCSLATMVALRGGLEDDIAGSRTAASISSIANMAELSRQSSAVRVRLEKDALSGLALGLAPVYDAGEDHQESFLVDGHGGGLSSRTEDLESRLTARSQTRTRMVSSARDG
ncbi:Protein of unknown function (DUF3176) domain containing protein [Rhypophila sp. PSN 637]